MSFCQQESGKQNDRESYKLLTKFLRIDSIQDSREDCLTYAKRAMYGKVGENYAVNINVLWDYHLSVFYG